MKIKHLITTALAATLFTGAAVAQQNINKCYSYQHALELLQNDPVALQKFLDPVEQEKQSHWSGENSKTPNVQSAPRIIPVVFHVLHQGGAENISKAQILDQIRILNEDYIRANPDTVNTPAPFAAVAANCNIEFRLAQKDPSGNCTDGIERIYTPLTNNADDNSKLSDWPSTKYLNIWVVKSIYSSSSGTILGYAQFPGIGNPATDGVMLRSDCVGSIGTAASGPFPTEVGRTATHEVGHWLNLRHIWGDNTCGSDFVADTPEAQDANSGCPSFPYHVSLCVQNQTNGEMYCNYMDYSNGNCENEFTQGQKTRMDATLNGTRANLISASNLLATGTNTTTQSVCAPKADFSPFTIVYICAGGTVNFSSAAYNAQPTAWSWSFPGGTPSTVVADSTPSVVYNTPGMYNVSLTVSNGSGSNTVTKTALIHVYSTTAVHNSWQYWEGFESMPSLPSTDWEVVNDNNNAWNVVTGPNQAGVKSARLVNTTASAGDVDELVGPSINLASIQNPVMSFWVAYAQRTSSDADKLQVYVSTNCGQTWALRYTKTGATLKTANPTTSSYVPPNQDWRQETVNIAPYTASTNFRFKFVFTSDGGNNVYIDQINLVGASSVSELENVIGLQVFPNPFTESSSISFSLNEKSEMKISMSDMLGRKVADIYNGTLGAGEHQFNLDKGSLESGIYFIQVQVNGQRITRKIVID